MRLWPVFVLLTILTILTIHAPSFAQTNSTPIAPVVLFVHGFCGGPGDWQKAELFIAQSLHTRYTNLYPDVSQDPPKSYAVFYNPLWFEQQGGKDVLFQEISPVRASIGSELADSDARFFRVAFNPDDYEALDYNTFTRDAVAQIPILDKATELAKIIAAIRQVTNIRPIVLVTHSMGGLVARAMLEDVADVYSNVAGAQGNILLLAQLDTPNLGVSGGEGLLDKLLHDIPYFDHCIGTPNFFELIAGSDILATINDAANVANYPTNVPLRSIVDLARPEWGAYYSPHDPLYFAVQHASGMDWNDGVVPQSSQDITSIARRAPTFRSLFAYIPVRSLSGCSLSNPLHLLGCLSNQSQVKNILNSTIGTYAAAQADLAIDKPRGQLFVNTPFAMQVRVDGLTSTAVHWAIAETSGASIDKNSGVFVATSPGIYHVAATTLDPFCVLDNCQVTLQDTQPIQVVQPSKPGFSIFSTPQIDTVIQGQTASFTLSVQSQGGFSSPVTPFALGRPRGVSTWSPPTLTPPPDGSVTSTLTIVTSQTTTPGSYRMRLRASAQGQRIQELVVIARVAKPSFVPIWPMSGHDPQRTGLSQFAGPNSSPGSPHWTFATRAPVVGDLAISAEGIIYFGSDQLYALNPDGTWYAPPVPITGIQNSPAIDDNSGYVYVPVSAPPGYDLLRFTKQLTGRTTVMHIPPTYYDYGISAPIIGTDGTVYVMSGGYPATVYSVSASTWQNSICPYAMGSFGTKNAPMIGVDGAVYVMCDARDYMPGGGLYKLDKTTGSALAFYAYTRGASELMMDRNQLIHAGFEAFFGVSYGGSFDTWDSNLNHISGNGADYTTGRASLFPDGSSTVRPGYSSGFNNAINAEGAHSWEVDADGSTLSDFSSVPSVDAVGTVYVGNTTGLVAYRNDGSAAWSYSTGDTITTQPVISNNGALYVGSSSGNVYAFQVSSGNQGAMPSPSSPILSLDEPRPTPAKPIRNIQHPGCKSCPSER